MSTSSRLISVGFVLAFVAGCNYSAQVATGADGGAKGATSGSSGTSGGAGSGATSSSGSTGTTETNAATSGSSGTSSGSTGSTSSTGGSSGPTTGSTGTTSSGTTTTTTGTSGTTGSSGSTGSSGTTGTDYSWAQWPVPPDSPPTSEYAITTDTVTDNVTGLMWERVVPSGTYTWQQAKDYCSTLALAGYSDWRLPARIELVSIVDYGTYNPAINSTAFPNTPTMVSWTSSPLVNSTGYEWIVAFAIGDTGHNMQSPSATTYSVRCVRGGSGGLGGLGTSAPQGQYTVTADTVHDNETGLTWQRAAPSQTYMQSDASSYCQALALGGLSGWRLPTVKELQTIVDDRTYSPAIDITAFPNTLATYFWTSSPLVFRTNNAWVVEFSDGYAYQYTPSAGSVRCVR